MDNAQFDIEIIRLDPTNPVCLGFQRCHYPSGKLSSLSANEHSLMLTFHEAPKTMDNELKVFGCSLIPIG
jgi:hypothetical protein